MLLDTRTTAPPSVRQTAHFPGERNKTYVYFVSFVRAFYLTGLGCPAQRNKIRLIVAFAFRESVFLLSAVLFVGYHRPPSMSTRFSPG